MDSDTEIDLDQRQTKKPSPELDLRIHPPLRRQSAIRFPTDPDATLHMAPIRDECRIPKVEQKNDRSVRVEYSRVRESSETRSKERCKTRSKSAKTVSRHRESPPDDSSDSSDTEKDRRQSRDMRRDRPRRRGDPSPDGDGSGDDSSTDGDETEPERFPSSSELSSRNLMARDYGSPGGLISRTVPRIINGRNVTNWPSLKEL